MAIYYNMAKVRLIFRKVGQDTYVVHRLHLLFGDESTIVERQSRIRSQPCHLPEPQLKKTDFN